MRIRLDIAYDGAGFHGWAAQPGLRTVQGEVETALAAVLREPISLTVAGRTDAGVHARGQVAHCDVSREAWERLPGRSDRSARVALVRAVNAVLARQCSAWELGDGNVGDGAGAASQAARVSSPRGYSDVIVRGAQEVPDSFDARFSALWRQYSYVIADSASAWDPLQRNALWLAEELDVETMNRAARPLLGEHDFLSFCKPREGASTVRTLLECRFERAGERRREEHQPAAGKIHPDAAKILPDAGVAQPALAAAPGVITASVRADAFCHSQVRSLMGALIEVGRGRKPASWPAQLLAHPSRAAVTAPIAPGHPLTLEAVGYPDPEKYAAQAARARTYRGC